MTESETVCAIRSGSFRQGTEPDISVGVGTVGGMLLGTVALLFVVPSLFILFQYLQEHCVFSAPRLDG